MSPRDPKRTTSNFDELFEQIERDELLDGLRQMYNTPRRYAKARGIAPQNVYYYIRTGKLTSQECPGNCGCRVIETTEADEVLGFTPIPTDDERIEYDGDDDDWDTP